MSSYLLKPAENYFITNVFSIEMILLISEF